jgi:hypothetical protein
MRNETAAEKVRFVAGVFAIRLPSLFGRNGCKIQSKRRALCNACHYKLYFKSA